MAQPDEYGSFLSGWKLDPKAVAHARASPDCEADADDGEREMMAAAEKVCTDMDLRMASFSPEPAYVESELTGKSSSWAPADLTERHGHKPHSLEAFHAAYRVDKVLKTGSFASVHLAQRKRTREMVAVKQVRSGDGVSEADVRAEAALMKHLDHPNVVRTRDAFWTAGLSGNRVEVWLVEEFAQGGELFGWAVAREQSARTLLVEADHRRLASELLSGLAYVHANGVLHRDIKPRNLLMSSAGAQARLLIADFGLFRRFDKSSEHERRDQRESSASPPPPPPLSLPLPPEHVHHAGTSQHHASGGKQPAHHGAHRHAAHHDEGPGATPSTDAALNYMAVAPGAAPGVQRPKAVGFQRAAELQHPPHKAKASDAKVAPKDERRDERTESQRKRHSRVTRSFVGTPGWMAPEVLACACEGAPGYSFAADIWSAGTVLYALMTKRCAPPRAPLAPTPLDPPLEPFGHLTCASRAAAAALAAAAFTPPPSRRVGLHAAALAPRRPSRRRPRAASAFTPPPSCRVDLRARTRCVAFGSLR